MNEVSLFTIGDKGRLQDALVDSEATLRKAYPSIEAGDRRSSSSAQRVPTASHPPPSTPSGVQRAAARAMSMHELLLNAATFLEFVVVLAGWCEVVHELGIATAGDALAQAPRLKQLTRSVTGYDLEEVMSVNLHRFPPDVLGRTPDPSAPAALPIELIVSTAASNVATCPITRLETCAAVTGAPALGHRCRKAYDALAAFARRNNLQRDDGGRVLGRAYSEGRLSLYEVADAMDLPVEDAVVFLDRHGFARHVDKVRLSDDERNAAYARMRSDRLARRGARPSTAGELARRNVLDSQRIEDIDARRWQPQRDQS